MIFLYLAFVLIFICGLRFVGKGINKDYINKNTTTIINGLFVITIFFSHFKTYLVNTNEFDNYLNVFLGKIGQLMVTSFLFYSGYGIYESIKNKKDYIKIFFIKRFIPTFFNFALAVIIFLLVDLIIGNNYSLKTILLSFTGYESIGNSNWYMLAIFSLYIFIMICFSNLLRIKDLYRIILIIVLSTIYIFVVSRFKESHYTNTVLCFSLGMMYSYFKDQIEKSVFKKYYTVLIAILIVFIGLYIFNMFHSNVYTYNVLAMSFILLIVISSMKFKFKNIVYCFFGKYVFWIYILQRIPMMIFKGRLNNYIYFVISFLITIILSYILKGLTDRIWTKLFNQKCSIKGE